MELAVGIIGAIAALLAVLVAQIVSDRAGRKQFRLDRRLDAASEAIQVLPAMSRRLTNWAYLPMPQKHKRELAPIVEYHESAIAWNAALSRGLAFLTPPQAAQLIEIDREIDRLLDLAVGRQWERGELRPERLRLGELAMSFINDVRESAGLDPVDATTIWAWADVSPANAENHD